MADRKSESADFMAQFNPHYTRDGQGIIDAVSLMFGRGTFILGEGDVLLPVQEAFIAYRKANGDTRYG